MMRMVLNALETKVRQMNVTVIRQNQFVYDLSSLQRNNTEEIISLQKSFIAFKHRIDSVEDKIDSLVQRDDYFKTVIEGLQNNNTEEIILLQKHFIGSKDSINLMEYKIHSIEGKIDSLVQSNDYFKIWKEGIDEIIKENLKGPSLHSQFTKSHDQFSLPAFPINLAAFERKIQDIEYDIEILIETLNNLEIGTFNLEQIWDNLQFLRHSNSNEVMYGLQKFISRLTGPGRNHISVRFILEMILEKNTSLVCMKNTSKNFRVSLIYMVTHFERTFTHQPQTPKTGLKCKVVSKIKSGVFNYETK